jgi:hypothetical protein
MQTCNQCVGKKVIMSVPILEVSINKVIQETLQGEKDVADCTRH